MNLDSLELSDEELETVSRFNDRFTGQRYRISAETLIDDWMSLVTEVEGGYADSVDDYGNDLTRRDLLEDLIRGSQPSLRAKLTEVLGPWDERFMQATTHDDEEVLSRYFNIRDGWWWRRIPTKGRLAIDLRHPAPSPDPEPHTGTDRQD